MNADLSTHILESVVPGEMASEAISDPLPPDAEITRANTQLRQLSMRLRSLNAFFEVTNHPLSDAEVSEVLTRNFKPEVCILREILLRSLRLTQGLLPLNETFGLPVASAETLSDLAETLGDAAAICDAMTEGPRVSLHAFAALGKTIKRALAQTPAAAALANLYTNFGVGALQPPLRAVIDDLDSDKLSADLRRIFVDLARMLDYLSHIEADLRADYPLKHALAIFTLLHEEARALQHFIEKRSLRISDVGEEVTDILDSTGYALDMELRKVYGYELTGLASLRQPTLIYVKVEQAHGLLSNCFQQSTVALAQAFDSSIEGTDLFQTFQTRLEQSLRLCRDLWQLLQFVRHASQERDRYPVSSFKSRLKTFREGSLRHLMYKDWEAYERFAEEIGATRGAVELAPVLHRFDCYLETLLGQVRMRAVLANQPLDFLHQ